MDLHPEWIGAGGEGIYNTADMTPAMLRRGIGLMFDCPKGCADENEDEGAERYFVQLANPLDGGSPLDHGQHPIWTRTGEDFETLTLAPSILSDPAKGGCGWHGYITNGEIVNV